MGENFKVTLPSWICAPAASSLLCTRAELTYTPWRLPWSSITKVPFSCRMRAWFFEIDGSVRLTSL